MIVTTTLTRAALQQLQALEQQATPQPWKVAEDTCDECRAGGESEWEWDVDPVCKGKHGQFNDKADAAFIAALRNAAPALIDLALAQQWQPMETAPKDTAVIVYNCGFCIAHYNTHYGRWIGHGPDTSDTRALAQFHPTHWMPLPLPPSEPRG